MQVIAAISVVSPLYVLTLEMLKFRVDKKHTGTNSAVEIIFRLKVLFLCDSHTQAALNCQNSKLLLI